MNIPLNIDWQQILLHLLNFSILAGGLYFLLYRPVKDFMAKREAYYAGQAAQAEKTAREAEELRREYEDKLAQAEKEIAREREAARTAAREDARRELETARTQAGEILAEAQTQARRSCDEMKRQAGREIKALAEEAAEKLVFASDGEAFDRFLDLTEKGGGGDGRA